MNKCIYKNRLGKTGEIIAKEYLMEKGHRFIANNYRYERSEIDLIFCDDPKKLLMFIEVKTRRNRKFGEPEESINSAKQSSIKKAAEGFMLENSAYEGFDMRIDVISIFIDSSGSEVNHIENAF
jgi:putative endonuclease